MMTRFWMSWIQNLYDIVRPTGNNGTTAQRPTKNLYVGQQYIDKTLGKPIWIKSLGPTVWIDATGGVV
jgi:hypothetical protein